MVLLQDSKLILFHFKTSLCIPVKTSRDILMLRRAVEQSCSPPPAGKGLPTFCLIILGLYHTVRYFITAKKFKTFVLSPLSCSNTQQCWSASAKCPPGADNKCKFSKEHLSNINTGSVLLGLSDFPLLQKNPHEDEILNVFCSCMTVRCTRPVRYSLPPADRCDLLEC